MKARRCAEYSVRFSRIWQSAFTNMHVFPEVCALHFRHTCIQYALHLHEQNSAELEKELLSEYSELSPEDQLLICRAILCHHASATASNDLSRLLRDAHILNRYTSAGHTVRRHELDRLKQLVPEWKLLEPQRSQITDTPDPVYQGNRYALHLQAPPQPLYGPCSFARQSRAAKTAVVPQRYLLISTLPPIFTPGAQNMRRISAAGD